MLLVFVVATILLANHANAADSLNQNEILGKNGLLQSLNGNYKLTLQGDGNLVLRDNPSGAALWATGTTNTGDTLNMQSDGNLVLRNAAGAALWSSATSNTGATHVKVFDNGALAIMKGTTLIKSIYGTVPVSYALTVNNGGGDGSYAAGRVVTIIANAAP